MKRIKWRFTLLSIGSLYLSTALSTAQSLDPPVHQPTFRTETQAPNVAMLNRFGDYPVDLANGLVDISIPLHTVQGRQLSLPITMRFHASGLRASDYEGPIGLNWALDAGGHISRSVRGYPDEMMPFIQGLGPNYVPHFGILFGTTLKGETGANGSQVNTSFYSNRLNTWDPSLPNTYGEYRDTEYDIFTYRLPNGKSGKFILEDVNGTKVPFVIPYEPIRIQLYRNLLPGNRFDAFEITDTDGTKYRFGRCDSSSDGSIDYNLGGNFSSYGTTWYLTSIASADGLDMIRLQYGQASVSRIRTGDEGMEISDNIQFASETPFFNGTDPSPSLYDILGDKMLMDNVDRFDPNTSDSQWYKPLASIAFEGGTVEFVYVTPSSATKTLQEIVVRDNLTSPAKTLKRISFAPLVRRSGGYPGLLTQMSISNNGNDLETYRFDYYNTSNMPNYYELIDNQDAWGFYRAFTPNGIVQDVVEFSRPLTGGGSGYGYQTNIGAGSARTAVENDMKIGMIKSIAYPAGGRTDFDYAANTFNYYGHTISGPGLRIKSIVNYPDPALSSQKEERNFAYAAPRIPDYMVPTELYSSAPSHKNRYTEKEMLVYLRSSGIDRIGYYTIRLYNNQWLKEYFDFSSSLLSYEEVTEYLGTTSVNSGKIVSRYTTDDLETVSWTHEPQYTYPTLYPQLRIDPQNYWLASPRITSKELYLRNGSNYETVHKSTYTYNMLTQTKKVYDLHVERFREHHVIDFDNTGDGARDTHLVELAYNGKGYYGADDEDLGYPGNFAHHNQIYNTGAVKLTSVTETSYSGGLANISTTESYTYNDRYLLSGKSKTNSDGKTATTTYRYPFEITGGVYPSMSSNNMLSMPVEITERYDNKVIGGTLTTYKNFGTSTAPRYYPEYLYALKKQENLSFSAYTGVVVSSNYITPPVSQVTQRDARGNVLEVLEKGMYATCLWGYNSRYPVAEIKNMRYSAVPSTITGALTNSHATTPYETILAPLRNTNGVLATIYTHIPLVGVGSITDPSGRKTSYEYDGLGRLTFIRDEEGNILEKYEYHFMNQ